MKFIELLKAVWKVMRDTFKEKQKESIFRSQNLVTFKEETRKTQLNSENKIFTSAIERMSESL